MSAERPYGFLVGRESLNVVSRTSMVRTLLTRLVAQLGGRDVRIPESEGPEPLRVWAPKNALRCCTATALASVLIVGAREVALSKTAVAYSNSVSQFVIGAANGKTLSVETAATGSRNGRDGLPTTHELASRLLAARLAALQDPAALVGDSIMLGTHLWIARNVHVVHVDAVVGRGTVATRRAIARMHAAGQLQPTMIVDLGNNGTVDELSLIGILAELEGCKRVVIVNARVPRPWQVGNDAIIARIVPQHRNAAVADWFAASAGHPEFFGADGVHPRTAGARAYATVIMAALEAQAKQSVLGRSRSPNYFHHRLNLDVPGR